MKKNSLALLSVCVLLLAINFQLPAQKSASDCSGAIRLKDSTYVHYGLPKGHGKEVEVVDSEFGDDFYKLQHHSVWYIIHSAVAGYLTFEILPHNLDDNYDFALFEDTTDFCELIKVGKVTPLRKNFSQINLALNSMTGLSTDDEYKSSNNEGVGSPYSDALKVKAKTDYYIVVDNINPEGEGHDLFWEITPDNPDDLKPKVRTITLIIKSYNVDTREEVRCDLSLRPRGSSSYQSPMAKTENGNSLFAEVLPLQKYVIYADGDDFFPFKTEITAPNFADTLHVEALLEERAVGNKVIIPGVVFEGTTSKMDPRSTKELKHIRKMMRDNPSMRIEIQGHVNSPKHKKDSRGERQLQRVSEERAEEVYDFLIQRGIKAERLSYRGFSNSRMLHENPQTNKEREENKRVEFEILAL